MANDESQSGEIQNASTSEPAVHSEKARGAFDLRSKRNGSGPNKKIYLAIALVIAVFLVAVIVFWTYLIRQMTDSSGQVDESTAKADVSLQVDKGRDESMETAKAEKVRLMKMQEQKEQKEQRDRDEQERLEREREKPPTGQGPTSARSQPGNDGPQPQTPAQRKLGGGIVMQPMLQDVSASGATVPGDSNQASGAGDSRSKHPSPLADVDQGYSSPLGGGQSPTRGSLSNLSGTGFGPSKAVLAPARKYLLTHNTYTRCALYTEIVTDQPGLIECRLTDPLYSADGSTVIANAGDKLTGEQKIELKPGQVRIFSSWTELETQSGARARIDSLGAGPMGASGTEGWIDNHYRERFGGAVMLSVLQDSLKAVANTTQKSGSSSGYTVNNSEQNVENMASKALENSINIPPTGHLSPGTVLTVIVARDIDFSSVFENR